MILETEMSLAIAEKLREIVKTGGGQARNSR